MRHVQALLNWILLSTGRTDLKRLEEEEKKMYNLKSKLIIIVIIGVHACMRLTYLQHEGFVVYPALSRMPYLLLLLLNVLSQFSLWITKSNSVGLVHVACV